MNNKQATPVADADEWHVPHGQHHPERRKTICATLPGLVKVFVVDIRCGAVRCSIQLAGKCHPTGDQQIEKHSVVVERRAS